MYSQKRKQIQIHNQSLCEERSNLTIKSKNSITLERIKENVIA